MPLKKQKGNMYPWVTHMHSHLGGACPHKCGYCYVQTNPHGVHPRWKGDIRLIEDELKVNYGSGKTIFIEHMGDLFAEGVKDTWIRQILKHCREYPTNNYILQTKNPQRAWSHVFQFPSRVMVGTTIETNRTYKNTSAPASEFRYKEMMNFKDSGFRRFITIEPIMDFDLEVLVGWLKDIKPDFVNVGADSKGCNLPEPSPEKVQALINELQKFTEIRNKSNLNRILKVS